jgi:hypothetical protein
VNYHKSFWLKWLTPRMTVVNISWSAGADSLRQTVFPKAIGGSLLLPTAWTSDR